MQLNLLSRYRWFLVFLLITSKSNCAQLELERLRTAAQHPSTKDVLFGLWQSLRQQGRVRDAQKIRARFERAWKGADVRLEASTF